MNIAIKAVGKLDFLEIRIFNPVLPVASPTKGNHYLVGLCSIAHKSVDFCDWVVDVEDFSELEGRGCFTSPTLYALLSAKSHCRKLHNFLRDSDIVGRGRLSVDL